MDETSGDATGFQFPKPAAAASLLASIAVGVGQASGKIVPENLWFFPFPCVPGSISWSCAKLAKMTEVFVDNPDGLHGQVVHTIRRMTRSPGGWHSWPWSLCATIGQRQLVLWSVRRD